MFHGVWPHDGRIISHYYTILLVIPTVTSVWFWQNRRGLTVQPDTNK